MAAALTWLDAAEAIALRLDLAEELAIIAALRANFAILAGDLDAADEWAATAGLSAAELDVRREAELMTLARALAARGRADQALRIAGGLLAYAEAAGRCRSVIECELVRALALERAGQTTTARAALATALGLAAPEGLVRPFRDAGPTIDALIESLRADPRAADPATALARGLAALTMGRALTSAPPTAPRLAPGNDYESLSERELRVLGLIAADCSNQEIASALIVSVNTVKTHIKRIYEKLQVNSRVGALERARELGLYQ
jgi:LuxR family maltose regulon positive regulatory protein